MKVVNGWPERLARLPVIRCSMMQARDPELKLAPIGGRFLAGIVDFLFYLLLQVGSSTVGRILLPDPPYALSDVGMIMVIAVWYVWIFGLPIVAMVVLDRVAATPGRRLTNSAVVRLDGSKPPLGLMVLRTIIWVLGTMAFFIGIVCVFWKRERQALHDMLCGTLVVEHVLVPKEPPRCSRCGYSPVGFLRRRICPKCGTPISSDQVGDSA